MRLPSLLHRRSARRASGGRHQARLGAAEQAEVDRIRGGWLHNAGGGRHAADRAERLLAWSLRDTTRLDRRELDALINHEANGDTP